MIKLGDIINKLEVNEKIKVWGVGMGQEFSKCYTKISQEYQTLNTLIELERYGKTTVEQLRNTELRHLILRKVLKIGISVDQNEHNCIRVQIDM